VSAAGYLALDRRRLLLSGPIAGGILATVGARRGQATAAETAVRRPVLGWLVMRPDGTARLDLLEMGAAGFPTRLLRHAMISAPTVAAAGRAAIDVSRQYMASAWGVSAITCLAAAGEIRHEPTGRSVALRIWADFA
jgi:hypothetical protein